MGWIPDQLPHDSSTPVLPMPSCFYPERYLPLTREEALYLKKEAWTICCDDYIADGMPFGMTAMGVVAWLEEGELS